MYVCMLSYICSLSLSKIRAMISMYVNLIQLGQPKEVSHQRGGGFLGHSLKRMVENNTAGAKNSHPQNSFIHSFIFL